MLVTIEYCKRWGYRERAASLATRIKLALPAEVKLIESSGGVFEVVADGTLLWSKKQQGEFPDEGRLVETMRGKWSVIPRKRAIRHQSTRTPIYLPLVGWLLALISVCAAFGALLAADWRCLTAGDRL